MALNRKKRIEELEEELLKLKSNFNDLKLYFDQIASFLPMAVSTITKTKNFIGINSSFEELVGYSNSEIVDESIDLVFKNNRDVRDLIDLVEKNGKTENKETTLTTSKNKEIPINVFCGERTNNKGEVTGYFLAVVDMTESKRFKEELEEIVKERTKQLTRRLNELEVFHNMTLGRELKMIELKKRIKELENNLEKKK